MSSWQPYTLQLRRLPDFLVSYRFYSTAEGGRRALPYQGYRSDLRYEQNHSENGQDYDGNYMVWPEFLTENGVLIEEAQTEVPVSGHAYMWVINYHVYRGIHRKLAVPGARCWFMEGSRRVAEAEVVEQIGLIHEATEEPRFSEHLPWK